MSKKFLTSIDLNKNELQNARFQNLAAAPISPVNGQVYYDTAANTTFIYENGVWVAANAAKVANGSIPLAKLATDPLARVNHTGTQTASTISDFDTQVRTSRLDQMAAPNAAVSLNAQRITNLADPVNPQDAATKAYADASSAGIDAKASVRAGTTENITLSGTQTIDGVALNIGDRVLVKDQTSASANGIYVVAAGSWARASDCNNSSNYTPQAFCFLEEGDTLASSQWKVSTSGVITVGTTDVTWAQFGAVQVFSAGAGLTLTGNEFNVGAGAGVIVNADTIEVDTAVVVRKYVASIGDGATSSLTVNHGLVTKDVTVSLREISTDNFVEADIQAASTNSVVIGFAAAPSTNSIRVVIHA